MKLNIPTTCLTGSALMAAALIITSTASAQNIFVADWYYPGAIYEFTPGSSPSTYYSGDSSNLGEPEGIAFNNLGDLFVADSFNGQIDEIMPNQTEITYASIPDPHGVAFDKAGDLFISGNNDGDIYEIKVGTTTVTTFATGLSGPAGLAFNQAGDLFVASGGSGVIDEYLNSGGILSPNATLFAQGFTGLGDIAIDGAGNVYVGNGNANGQIAKITPQGNSSVYATGFSYQNGLAFNTAGDLFVCDNGTVYEVAPGGGTGTVVASGLGNATGIAIEGIALPVPEPSTWALGAVGGVAFLFRRKKA